MIDLIKNENFWLVIAILFVILLVFGKNIFCNKKMHGGGVVKEAVDPKMNERRLLINRIVSRYGFSEELIKGVNQLNSDDLRVVLSGSSNLCGGKEPFKGLYLGKCPE